ncbi:hypothetical protein Tco_1181881 [Tanacetum coccineum]
MDSNFTNENDPWEYSLDIDDSDLHLTPVLRSSSSAHVEPSPYTPNPVTIIPGPAGVVQLSNSICVEPSSSTPNPVRIIPGPAGLVQRAKLLKENVFILDPDGALMSTQEYMQKVVEDVGEDADFNSGAWVSATNYVNAFGGTVTGCLGDIDNFLKKGKLEQVVAIVKSCSPNALGDLNVTLKDLSGTVPGTIHYKVLDVGSYEKDITVGAAMILANVSVFTLKPSKHYLNITKRNVVEVFRENKKPGDVLFKNMFIRKKITKLFIVGLNDWRSLLTKVELVGVSLTNIFVVIKNHCSNDAATEGFVSVKRDIYGLQEKKVASIVPEGKVDILVELYRHTHNKLGVMACRHAPFRNWQSCTSEMATDTNQGKREARNLVTDFDKCSNPTDERVV